MTMKPRLRHLWLVAHRWLGLTAGLVFVLLGLTGSLLVFDHAIDEWLHPRLLLTDGDGDRKPLAEIIAAANDGYLGDSNGVRGSALSVTKPRVPNGVWTVWFAGGTEASPEYVAVYVDPFEATINGQRTWGTDLMGIIYRLHFRLLAGFFGGISVGVIGMFLLVSLVSGIVLWWPLLKGGWRAAFAIRGGSRFNYDLHKTIGIGTSIFLLVITATGVYMEFPSLIVPVLEMVSTKTHPPEEMNSKEAAEQTSLTADEAIVIAQKQFPDATFDHLHPPADASGVYEVAFRQAGEVQSSFGRTQVFLDQYSGEIVYVHSPQQFTATDNVDAWQFPLHNGEAFGLVGRWCVFFIGLSPAILYVTGFILWYRRRQSRARQLARRVNVERREGVSAAV